MATSKKETFELNGRFYIYNGSHWLDAETFMTPPGVIQQALDRRYGQTMQETAVPRKSKKKSKSAVDKGIQKTVGPIMFDFIRRRYQETGDFVHSDEVAQYLFSHAEAITFIRQAYELTDKKKTFEQYVVNQVSWLAADLENPDRSEFHDLLEKKELPDGRTGFRPK